MTRDFIKNMESRDCMIGEYNGHPCTMDVSFLPEGYSNETLVRTFYYYNQCLDLKGMVIPYQQGVDLRIRPKVAPAEGFDVDFIAKSGALLESLRSDKEMLITLLAALMDKVENKDAIDIKRINECCTFGPQ